ncbi:hypothetical protein EK21DRAFT_51609 [Setomelanomma holmii]|uniref:HECT-type E3 ubiquitin transferase n=1 Tax=Setomelanomma holmii TaxID=210430 RepID=A0A9P4LV77_9PLEO|nr:hypothetical protein EK21DRAFT_51609 [Setomelanomma holmii]
MSPPDAASSRPREVCRSRPSNLADTPWLRRRRGSATLLENSSRHVIDVDDARRVLECSLVGRKLCFQHLVRHFLSQILHGCKSAYCDTPTCLSAQKRSVTKPIRPPTQLTARALAHYLASQDNAQRELCPHELKVSPTSFEIDGAIGAYLQHGGQDERHYNVYPAAWGLGNPSSTPHGKSSRAPAEASAQNGTSCDQQRVVDTVRKQRQARKDTKSLSQNLHDSFTMIFAYSQQLPSPLSVLDALRASETLQSDNATSNTSIRTAASQMGGQRSSPSTHKDGRVTGTNDDSIAPNVNGSVDSGHQLSQANVQTQCHDRASPSPPELLRNGQQVHRIPYHLRDPSSLSKSHLTDTQSRFDGSQDTPRLSIMKTGRKNFTLGGILSGAEQKLPPPATLKPSLKVERTGTPPDAILPALSSLNSDTLEQLKDDAYDHRKSQLPDAFNFAVDYDGKRHFRPSKPFVNRSLYYTLSDADALLQSFHDNKNNNNNNAFATSPLPHLDSARLTHSFRDWNQRNGALIFDSLWHALETLYTPPPELLAQKSPRLRPSRKGVALDSSLDQSPGNNNDASKSQRYLNNVEAAHIVIVCIHALTSLVSVGWPHTWAQLRKLRAWGVIVPNAAPDTNDFTHPYLNIIDELEYEPAVRLADRLFHAIGARTCFEQIQTVMRKQEGRPKEHEGSPNATVIEIVIRHLAVVERVALDTRRRLTPMGSSKFSDDPGWTVTATFVEWLKTIVIKKWDSKPIVKKWSTVGTAITLLDRLSMSFKLLNLRENMLEIPFLNERLDGVEEPLRFLRVEDQPNTLHVLQYPSLFPMEYLVRYFRTINFTSMMAQYDQTTRVRQMQRSLDMFLRDMHRALINDRMHVTLSEYLVMDISRDHPLQDTLDQLWGLEKRMLLKPLKVNMGKQEGEVGADHGGVTYEFFRVVLSEAFKPDHGMFTLQPQTRMTWFQPGTLEPDWKFEMIGMLFSLAVYNGITLPVTFPLALYRSLLPPAAPLRDRGHSEKLVDLIEDGWPDLAKGFEQLLTWTNGDVQDVFMREYAFSYEVFGQRIDHNMDEPYAHMNNTPTDTSLSEESPQSPATKEFKLVTNTNRTQFVHDYIHHLTHASIAPQLHAFRKGFYACLNPKSLHFFSPATLRHLIEGQQHISIPSLRAAVRYEEGYSPTHQTIQNFWKVVEGYTQEEARQLLEFVTASDRVPVTGYEGITFYIVRIGNTDMLPTSSTCFGKLYLPEYVEEEVLRTRLGIAIGYARGFGVV